MYRLEALGLLFNQWRTNVTESAVLSKVLEKNDIFIYEDEYHNLDNQKLLNIHIQPRHKGKLKQFLLEFHLLKQRPARTPKSLTPAYYSGKVYNQDDIQTIVYLIDKMYKIKKIVDKLLNGYKIQINFRRH